MREWLWWDQLWGPAAKPLTKVFNGAKFVEEAGPDHAHQDFLRSASRVDPIAAPDLAVDDTQSHSLLRTPVGCVQARLEQEPEPLPQVFFQVLSQAFVGHILFFRRRQFFQVAGQSERMFGQLVR